MKVLAAVEEQIEISPTTFLVFLAVLQSEPHLENLEKLLRDAYCEFSEQPIPSLPTLISPPASPMNTYASYLKSVYIAKKLPTYNNWSHVKAKKFINLTLIETEDIEKQEGDWFMIHGKIDEAKRSRSSIEMSEIAQLPDGSQPKCILVEGAPGVGKSTFAWKLCRKWGKGKLLQQYQLVVLLML